MGQTDTKPVNPNAGKVISLEEAFGGGSTKTSSNAGRTLSLEEAFGSQSVEKAPEDMSWGETAIDTGKALAAGAARGTAAVAGLPGDALNAGQWGMWKLNQLFDEDAPEPDWEATPLTSAKTIGALSDLTGGATDYRGKTTPAEYAETIGEFVPGLIGGGGNLVKKGVQNVLAPALASETAAQLTEDTEIGKKYEPLIRIAAAVAGSGAAHMAPKGQKGAEIAAGKKILEASSDPDAVIESASRKAKEILPGSPPTLAEISGDIGISQATKTASAKSPNMRAAQTDIQGQANSARMKALEEMVPDNSNPMDAVDALKEKTSAIEASGSLSSAAAERALKKKLNALPPSNQPEAIGSTIRGDVVAKKAAEKSILQDMYHEVDPTDSLIVVTEPISKKAKELLGEIGPVMKPLQGEEAAIFKAASSYSPTDKFQGLIDLRKRINDEVARLNRAGEGGRSIPRLNALRESVENAIDDSFQNQQTWKTPAGYSGPQPNMTPKAAERLRDANASFREYASTYRQGPVSDILGSTGYGFSKTESSIPQKAFSPGQTGGQTTASFIKAAGANPTTIAAIKEAAMIPLRAAMKGAEHIDEKALTAWKTKYKFALDELKKHDPKFVKGIDEAVAANTKMMKIADDTKSAVENATIGKAKDILGAVDNDAVRNKVTGAILSKDGSKHVSDILSSVSHSPAAVNGVKAAGIKGIIEKASNAGMAGGDNIVSGAKLRKIVAENQESIKALYGQDGLDRFNKIASDLERSEIAASNAKFRGDSGTASMMLPGVADAAKKSAFSSVAQFLSAVSYNAGALGHLGTAAGSAVGAFAAGIVDKLRSAGISRINDIYERALLDPNAADKILKTVSKNKGIDKPAIDAALNALLAIHSSDIRDRYKSGGRVGVNHEAEADRLIDSAMKAHLEITQGTEHLLNQPDDAIIKALSIANKEI